MIFNSINKRDTEILQYELILLTDEVYFISTGIAKVVTISSKVQLEDPNKMSRKFWENEVNIGV